MGVLVNGYRLRVWLLAKDGYVLRRSELSVGNGNLLLHLGLRLVLGRNAMGVREVESRWRHRARRWNWERLGHGLEIRVIQGVRGRKAFIRIKFEKSLEQVDSCGGVRCA